MSIATCDYGPIVISDHCPLPMKMRIPVTHFYYRPCRLNPLLLSEEAFTNFISSQNTLFLDVNRTPGMSSLTIWESLKAYLRHIRLFHIVPIRKKASTARLKELADEILELDRLHSQIPTADSMKNVCYYKPNLMSYQHDKLNILSPNRVECYEHGEKTGRLLAHQLQQRTANQTIPAIKNERCLKY